MQNKTFKIGGEEFGLVSISDDGWGNHTYALSPKEPIKKQEWEVRLLPEEGLVADYRIELVAPKHTPVDTAQAISECIKDLLKLIADGDNPKINLYHKAAKIRISVDQARSVEND